MQPKIQLNISTSPSPRSSIKADLGLFLKSATSDLKALAPETDTSAARLNTSQVPKPKHKKR